MLDLDLLGTLITIGATDPASVHQIYLEVGHGVEKLQQTIALQGIVVEEERVGSRNPQVLTHLCCTTGGGSLGLAEHEVGGGLLTLELGNSRDQILVAVKQQEIAGRR